ncbi:MAG: protein-L-isoaspartate(D-aspartate) O-methyltransferase [Mailhella sp.]|nr:protein-L-isoaspartate(D-aspartate) O-methyltransferase [Mailhella sp.]
MVIKLAERRDCDERVLSAMLRIRRHRFVEEALQAKAYEDIALPIGMGQTISRPSVVAYMCSLLRAEPGMRVLEIGAGSGYQTAVLAAMGLEVFAVERLEELCSRSAELLAAMRCSARLYCGDGTLGLPRFAPYDRIIVAAGGPVVPPPLAEQLSEGGVMVMPIGPDRERQRLKRIVRLPSGRLQISDCGPATFVDLVGRNGWDESPTATEQTDMAYPDKRRGQPLS